jgi:hypothetical protein
MCFASFDKIRFLIFKTIPKEIRIFVVENFLQKLNENNCKTELTEILESPDQKVLSFVCQL